MYAILKECPLFRGLTAAQIEDILADKGKYALSEYRDGDLIAQRDTAYSGLMIIIKGKVHGKMTYASGRSADIEPIEAPQLIAPAFLFGGYNKLPIDVIADGDVTIMTIHRGYIFELMQNNVVIMSNFVDILCQCMVEEDLLPLVPVAPGEGGELPARPYPCGQFRAADARHCRNRLLFRCYAKRFANRAGRNGEEAPRAP